MKPSIGIVALLVLSADHVEAITKQRSHEDGILGRLRQRGWFAPPKHDDVADPVVGDVLPFIVTKVWSDTMVNGQALLDGKDTLWLSSVEHNALPTPGFWHFAEEAAAIEDATDAPAADATDAPSADAASEPPAPPADDAGDAEAAAAPAA